MHNLYRGPILNSLYRGSILNRRPILNNLYRGPILNVSAHAQIRIRYFSFIGKNIIVKIGPMRNIFSLKKILKTDQ